MEEIEEAVAREEAVAKMEDAGPALVVVVAVPPVVVALGTACKVHVAFVCWGWWGIKTNVSWDKRRRCMYSRTVP